MDNPIVLGIETSCDETAAAVVAGDRTVLAERLLSQSGEHAPYGGVVPEIAARAHFSHLDKLVAETMTRETEVSRSYRPSPPRAGPDSSAASWSG